MLNLKSYINWREYSAVKGSVQEVTWDYNDLLTLPWKATYMTNEIPENDSWDTFATKNKKNIRRCVYKMGSASRGHFTLYEYTS